MKGSNKCCDSFCTQGWMLSLHPMKCVLEFEISLALMQNANEPDQARETKE